ncbi:hypothetical protein KA005_74465 [bacterium]|nr:hypothetical protein [bacterium]
MFKIVKRIYPDHKIVGINEIFAPGIGWYNTLVGCGLADALKNDIIPIIKKGKDAQGRIIEKIALVLEDAEGFQKIADFSIKELRS